MEFRPFTGIGHRLGDVGRSEPSQQKPDQKKPADGGHVSSDDEQPLVTKPSSSTKNKDEVANPNEGRQPVPPTLVVSSHEDLGEDTRPDHATTEEWQPPSPEDDLMGQGLPDGELLGEEAEGGEGGEEEEGEGDEEEEEQPYREPLPEFVDQLFPSVENISNSDMKDQLDSRLLVAQSWLVQLQGCRYTEPMQKEVDSFIHELVVFKSMLESLDDMETAGQISQVGFVCICNQFADLKKDVLPFLPEDAEMVELTDEVAPKRRRRTKGPP